MTQTILSKIKDKELEAKAYGFYWENVKDILTQIHSECKEVEELLVSSSPDQVLLEEEIGDLLHATLCLSIYFGFDPETTLEKSFHKFTKRFQLTQQFAAEDGHSDLHGRTVDEMMKYWNQAKKALS